MKQREFAPELCTDRLILKDITENDAAAIVEWRSNPSVYKYFISPHKITLDEHLNWFYNKYIFDKNRIDWIAFTENNDPVGIFGIKRENEEAVTAEISYILSPDYYGKGYASEAVKRIVLFCKDNWNCKNVVAEIHKDNAASIKFIERLSFKAVEKNDNIVKYTKNL